jgi:peptidyl-prolyl cis-trans isomerase SurA
MNKKIIIFVFIVLLINLKSYSKDSIFISYKVENEIITNIDIKNEAKYLLALNNQLKNIPNKQLMEIAKESILKEKIKKIELLKYFSLNQTNPYLDQIIENFYKRLNMNNLSEFEVYLRNYGLEISEIKKKVEIETVWNQLIYDKYIGQIILNEDLLIKKIRQMKKLNKKTSFLLSEIVFEYKKEKSLKDITKEIKSSIVDIGFENTANLFSVSDSSKFGGNIGWIDEENLSKKILKNIAELKIGEISDPIELGGNVLIIKLENIKKRTIKIDEKKELQKMKLFEQNKKLANFSKIYFNKVKINLNISEL